MENEVVEEIVNKCLDDWYQLWVSKWLDFLKTLEFDILTVAEIIERYEKQFNLVKKENEWNI